MAATTNDGEAAKKRAERGLLSDDDSKASDLSASLELALASYIDASEKKKRPPLAWTMSDAAYAIEMLPDAADMARDVAGFEETLIVCLDRKTARLCFALGERCAALLGRDPNKKNKPDPNKKNKPDPNKKNKPDPNRNNKPDPNKNMKPDPNTQGLKAKVQNTKFFVSFWLATRGVDFLFFEMDVWFARKATHAHPLVAALFTLERDDEGRPGSNKPDVFATTNVANVKNTAERDIVMECDLVVAAHQNNPTATNIGVYAVKASERTAGFFEDCVRDAAEKPNRHDQMIFHNMLSWHRLAYHKRSPPSLDEWKDRPTTPVPKSPIKWDFVAPHVGVCSTHPVPTERTVFVHTLGTQPLQSPHGKRIHAKELMVWHGGASSQYFDASNKYLALDGRPLNAMSIDEKDGYHNGRYLKARLAVLVALAKATGRVLILPKIIADYYVYFSWVFLDLKSLDGLCEWRESNFPANFRLRRNGKRDAFRSVAQVHLAKRGKVGLHLDNVTTWLRHDDVQEEDNTRGPAGESRGARGKRNAPSKNDDAKAAARGDDKDNLLTKNSLEWDLWASVLDALRDRDLLLVHDGFLDGEFVRLLTNCGGALACARHSQILGLVRTVYDRLAFCGDTVNLDRLAVKSFQGFDCYGQGVTPSSRRRRRRRRR